MTPEKPDNGAREEIWKDVPGYEGLYQAGTWAFQDDVEIEEYLEKYLELP